MENCEGGQRLPPDGDEFPTTYQEFGSSGSSSGNQPPYRYITATRTATMTANGGGLCGNESEPFRVGESLRTLANDSNVVGSKSIVLPDSKMTVLTSTENARQDISKVALTNMENARSRIAKTPAAPASMDNACQDAKSSELTNDERKPSYQASEGVAKKNAPIAAASSPYPCQPANSNLMMAEKKMEIAGYYHKDVTTIDQVPSHVEKDMPADTPPPLPLTGIHLPSD